MKSTTMLRTAVLLAAIAAAAPLIAKPVAVALPLTHTVRIGQVNVQSGDYRVSIDGNHLTILSGKKTIAEAEGRWEDRDRKADYTEVLANSDGKLLELRFAGKKSVFVLTQ